MSNDFDAALAAVDAYIRAAEEEATIQAKRLDPLWEGLHARRAEELKRRSDWEEYRKLEAREEDEKRAHFDATHAAFQEALQLRHKALRERQKADSEK
jgi:hypothetical protein